ncbi:MAG: hypothetical protein M1819_004357 [Sarea resinae]|nr:MAG: hypothetical protein M1819_004357 [Sarea resinae]
MDDLVAQFTSITDAPPQRAAQYLRLTDGNLEQAMQLYFDSDGMDLENQDMPAASSTTQHATGNSMKPPESAVSGTYEDSRGVVHIPSDDEIEEGGPEINSYAPGRQGPARADPLSYDRVDSPANQAAMEDDEAMARRLQEEMYAGADMAGDRDSEGVRAPIARTTETLVGPGADWGSDADDMRVAVDEQMLARRQRNQGRPGIFNQRATSSSVWDDGNIDSNSRRQNLAQATAGASEASSKSNLLAEMYRPPFELMSSLPWDDARQEGRDNEKWILVNIQDPAIFDCQVLNRDIWKNASIKETVKENFIFMQYTKDDPRGNQYIQYYFQARDSQDAYPHIAIVDPRTGEQVKVWSGPPVPKPMDFLMQLHEFLDRYSLKVNARNPVPTRKAEKKTVDVNTMTEEEMLEMAMHNSLANARGPREDDPDALTREAIDAREGKGKGKARAGAVPGEDETMTDALESNGQASAEPAVSVFSTISSSSPHEEPAANLSSTTRIQFRHSGGRIVRRFSVTDQVRRIYEWLKADPITGREGVEFELISMGKNLIDALEETVEQAGLKNATVMVEFLDD